MLSCRRCRRRAAKPLEGLESAGAPTGAASPAGPNQPALLCRLRSSCHHRPAAVPRAGRDPHFGDVVSSDTGTPTPPAARLTRLTKLRVRVIAQTALNDAAVTLTGSYCKPGLRLSGGPRSGRAGEACRAVGLRPSSARGKGPDQTASRACLVFCRPGRDPTRHSPARRRGAALFYWHTSCSGAGPPSLRATAPCVCAHRHPRWHSRTRCTCAYSPLPGRCAPRGYVDLADGHVRWM